MSGTPSIPEPEGWYINFQAAVLKQLPRPGEISKTVAKGWEDNQASLRKNLSECLLPPNPIEPLFEFVCTVIIPATNGKFVAKDSFKSKKDGGIFFALGDNFSEWFLGGSGKIEDPIAETMLIYGKPQESLSDIPMITALGGVEKSEIALAHMFWLVNNQKDGQAGILPINGWRKVFYIRDKRGILRSVSLLWGNFGWEILTNPIGSKYGMAGADLIFARYN